jgi:hypothetical protein
METAESQAGQGPLPKTQDEAIRITAAAGERGITAQTIGGLGVFMRCPSASLSPLERAYKDIDLVTTRSMTQRLGVLLEGLGHAPDKRFNAITAGQRMFFWDERNSRQLDVFIDRFEMCHTFDLRDRLKIDPSAPTLPLADLLLTKMQVVEVNQKDLQDMAALLQDHPFTDDEQGINIKYITGLTGSDWGLQHTLEKTIERLSREDALTSLKGQTPRFSLSDQLKRLFDAMQAAPKSIGWKVRSKIGEKKRWYELPEEART